MPLGTLKGKNFAYISNYEDWLKENQNIHVISVNLYTEHNNTGVVITYVDLGGK